MIKEYDKIMSMSVEEVISSSHSITLLRLYRLLYLNGSTPRWCAASQRKYYEQLKKDYMKNKEKLEKKHVLAFSGRKYIPGVFKDGELVGGHLHISSENLTDLEAIELLKMGALKEKDFKVLPNSKAKKEAVEYSKEEIENAITEGKYQPMLKIAKDLKLVKGNANKETIENKLNEYLAK
jgi:hypothetical protein